MAVKAMLKRILNAIFFPNADRVRRNAIDVSIERHEQRLEDLSNWVALYEEQSELMPKIEEVRQRRATQRRQSAPRRQLGATRDAH